MHGTMNLKYVRDVHGVKPSQTRGTIYGSKFKFTKGKSCPAASFGG
jgi:hypothetical protein